MPRNKKNARPPHKPFKINYDVPSAPRLNPHLDEILCQKVEPPQKRYQKESRVKAAIHNMMERYPSKSYEHYQCEQHWHYRELS